MSTTHPSREFCRGFRRRDARRLASAAKPTTAATTTTRRRRRVKALALTTSTSSSSSSKTTRTRAASESSASVSASTDGSPSSHRTNAPPPRTCAAAAEEARSVIRTLRDALLSSEATDESRKTTGRTRKIRIELPLPSLDVGGDRIAYLGLHGQAADWSGGMEQRYRVTRKLIEEHALAGYDYTYHGLLDRDAEGMGLWTCGDFMTMTTHPSDTTFGYFIKLLNGEYGGLEKIRDDPTHLVVVVNAFWSGKGESVGQPWEFGLKKAARETLGGSSGDWEKAYSCRRARSAAGVEGTLIRRWPGAWRLFDADGYDVVREWDEEPSNREIAEALNDYAGRPEVAGFNRAAADTSRDDDVIT